MRRLLVVDDEMGVQESLRMLFKDQYDVLVASGVEEALERVAHDSPDLVLLDLVMPGRSGMDCLKELQTQGNRVPVVVLTATQTVTTAVDAMKLGAVDYVTKPFDIDALSLKVRRLLERSDLEDEVARLRDEVDGRNRLGQIIGRSEKMRTVFRTVERVADSRSSVLIAGESGTGKELVARAIHELGPRSAGPFVAVNCAAIPHSLIESELFGHERGAFTDARDQRIGKFELANGGTLFLDEIGELAPAVQPKLLRALQERRFERVGGTEAVEFDTRVLSATNRDLEKEVEGGGFRLDLFYRINVVTIQIPPLRERREDISLLCAAALERACREAGRTPAEFSGEAQRALEHYPWPGNVRELENAIERAVALTDSPLLSLQDLPESIARSDRVEQLRADLWSGRSNLSQAVGEFERELLEEALAEADWNQTRAAERLGLTRRVLKLKMDRHGIEAQSNTS